MTTFYQRGSVRVTSELVEVDGRSYPFEELADVRHDGIYVWVRAWVYWIARGLAVLGLVALIPGLVVAIVIALRETSGIWGSTKGIGIALVVWGVLVYTCYHVGVGSEDHGTREIRARWRGDEVVLLRMTNLWEFGRVYRALRQASSNLAS